MIYIYLTRENHDCRVQLSNNDNIETFDRKYHIMEHNNIDGAFHDIMSRITDDNIIMDESAQNVLFVSAEFDSVDAKVREYIAEIDSLQRDINFLQRNRNRIAGAVAAILTIMVVGLIIAQVGA